MCLFVYLYLFVLPKRLNKKTFPLGVLMVLGKKCPSVKQFTKLLNKYFFDDSTNTFRYTSGFATTHVVVSVRHPSKYVKDSHLRE